MECSMKEDIKNLHKLETPEKVTEFNSIFDEECVDLKASPDDRPVIYVDDAYAIFNVTSKLTIKNLRFTGINQMAVPSSPRLQFSVIPKKLCELSSSDSSNSKGNLKLQKPIGDHIPFDYNCYDKSYSGSSLPPDDGIS